MMVMMIDLHITWLANPTPTPSNIQPMRSMATFTAAPLTMEPTKKETPLINIDTLREELLEEHIHGSNTPPLQIH